MHCKLKQNNQHNNIDVFVFVMYSNLSPLLRHQTLMNGCPIMKGRMVNGDGVNNCNGLFSHAFCASEIYTMSNTENNLMRNRNDYFEMNVNKNNINNGSKDNNSENKVQNELVDEKTSNKRYVYMILIFFVQGY